MATAPTGLRLRARQGAGGAMAIAGVAAMLFSAAANANGVGALAGSSPLSFSLALGGSSSEITVPDIYFISGVASNHNLRQYIPAEFDGMSIFIDGMLPAGVTFDDTLDAEQLVYDGTAGDTTVSGLLLVVVPE